jgi:hypothetical protein
MREIPVSAVADPDVASGKALRTMVMNFDGDRSIKVMYQFNNWEGDEFDKDMFASVISNKIMEIWNTKSEGSDA